MRKLGGFGRSHTKPAGTLPDGADVARCRRTVNRGNRRALGLTEQNVKVRLHRGRAMVRKWLFARVGGNAKGTFPFMGVRCDRVVRLVFARLEQ